MSEPKDTTNLAGEMKTSDSSVYHDATEQQQQHSDVNDNMAAATGNQAAPGMPNAPHPIMMNNQAQMMHLHALGLASMNALANGQMQGAPGAYAPPHFAPYPFAYMPGVMDKSKDDIHGQPKSDSFPAKLYTILLEAEEMGHQEVVSFVPEGNAFKIGNPERFEKEILGKFFRHNKLSSFMRQLYMYSFQKTARGRDKECFMHPYFQKGMPHLLSKIERKKQGFSFKELSNEDAEIARAAGCVENKSPKFPQKLYTLVLEAEKKGHANVACFTADGSGFKILDRREFEEAASKYFKFTSFPSFRRQLSLYGFTKGPDGSYKHNHFVKGKPELLREMKRNVGST